MNKLEKSIFEANKKRFQNAPNPLKSHGPDHHWRVYQYCLLLAKMMGVNYDSDVMCGAALLHDIAAYYPDEVGDNYHQFDDKIAKKILLEINFPQEKIDKVLYAIANHGSDPRYKKSDESIETTVLRDADKLDVFGPIGVARIIMVRSLKGDTLDEIVDNFYTKGHLKRKWESITTSEARSLAKENYSYSKNFFERLSRGIES